MEEIVELRKAWIGDLIEHKGKIFRVIDADIAYGGVYKELKMVSVHLKYPFTRVKKIYI